MVGTHVCWFGGEVQWIKKEIVKYFPGVRKISGLGIWGCPVWSCCLDVILISKHLLFLGGTGNSWIHLIVRISLNCKWMSWQAVFHFFVAYFYFLAVSYAIYVLCFQSNWMSCLFLNLIKHENNKWGGDYICLSVWGIIYGCVWV